MAPLVPTVIMPIAGAGSRFAASGEMRPKPLIEINGVPMAVWALRSLRAAWPEAPVVFVVLAEHEARWGVRARLAQYVQDAQFCVAPALTGGSLQTCLLAEPAVPPGRVIVLDSDLAVRSAVFIRLVEGMGQDDGGVLLSFPSQDPRYSYARVVDGKVLETAEKQVISSHALAGAYAFASAARFFDTAREMVRRNARVANGEFYTSAVFNQLIAAGRRVALAQCDDYWSFGTPEELQNCLETPEFHGFLKALAGRSEPGEPA